MKRDLGKLDLFESSHMIILLSYTFFATILIGETLLMSWEKWIILYALFGLGISWIMHIQQKATPEYRMAVYSVLMMVLMFFYGMHETSTFDIALVTSAVIMLYTMTGLKKYIIGWQITFYITFAYDIITYISSGRSYDSLEISRIMLHIVMMFAIGFFARAVIDKWSKVLDKSHEEIKELSNATDRLNDFLANVSHEIRTPVNAIIGLSGVCIEREDDEELAKDMQAVHDAGRKVATQISDILDYSEIDSNKLANNNEEYMLSSVLNDLVMQLRIEKDPSLELIIDVSPAIPSVMYTDVSKLKRILWHLISNGLKYTKEGGVYVKLYSIPEDYGINLCIEVTDTGKGMDEEELEHVFEGFYQGNSGRNRSSSGLGLGLSIVQGFVASLGGFMDVESKPDAGTTVRVSLPQKVIDPEGCMSVANRDRLCLGAFLNFDKYENPNVREYYNSMLGNIVRGLNVQMHRVDNLNNLHKLDESIRMTHLFISDKEYESDPAYMETLASKMILVVIATNDFVLPKGSKATIMEKPFYCFPVVSVLNRTYGEDEDVRRMVLKGVKVLVVDDESMNLVVAKGVFKRYEMEVETAPSGYEAIEMCRSTSYDIIFMDHMMPGMDGIETMKRIRSDKGTPNKDTPIVALTANAVSTAREMFMAEGFDGFVSKPIELIELERAIKKVVPEDKISYETAPKPTHVLSMAKEEEFPAGDKVADGNDMAEVLSRAGIDMTVGLHYCNDDMEFYDSLLDQFASESDEKKCKLNESFDKSDYKNYEIYIHALKSTAKMIGAIKLSDKARTLEDYAKEDGSLITEKLHGQTMELYDLTVSAIREAIGDDASEADTVSADDDEIFEFSPTGGN